MSRSSVSVDQHTPGQLHLPFLTLEQVAAIAAARAAAARAERHAATAGRRGEAVELARLGAQLVAMLEHRAPTPPPTLRHDGTEVAQ